ncbi:MAG: Gfo/Idh/MocA family oxidoreductase [Thermoguttaceae bacterium]|nr:Gfo/Idh/MocA family oxidoreductase [Thermoguttaceae bacterium]
MKRRNFLVSTVISTLATSLPLATPVFASGKRLPNAKIRVAYIGVGNRGSQLIGAFQKTNDPRLEIAALCDVYQPTLAKVASDLGVASEDQYTDFRKLYERQDIDAMIIATPDHWHAIQTVDACAAGFDVYIEKPLAMTVVEGRHMINAARQYQRVVQAGIHRRSSRTYQKAAQMIAEDQIGKVTVSRAYRVSNMAPAGIGHGQPTEPPAGLDWDLWIGPRAMQPYQENIAPYKFRWWNAYSSQMTNWGIHYLDAIRWLTGETAAESVCAMGGVYALDDDRTIPDTLSATWCFASGRIAQFGQYEATGTDPLPFGAELELRGTKGSIYLTGWGKSIKVVPSRPGQFQTDRGDRTVALEEEVDPLDATIANAQNFLDCVESRERPVADVETAHLSTVLAQIGNISLAVGKRLYWDATAERFIGSDVEDANALLHYEYRQPWKLNV